MNIVSRKAIEISPDLTVANLIQRVSGVSIERNSNGDGQYTILRGMDSGYDLIKGNAGLSFSTRSRFTQQQIINSTLQGNHTLLEKLKLNWSAVYSKATSKIPDNTSVSVLGEKRKFY